MAATKGKRYRQTAQVETSRTDIRWWLAKSVDDEPHKKIIPRVQSLRDAGQQRRDTFFRLADIYGIDLRTGMAARTVKRLSLNHAKNILNTYVSQMVRTRVMPMVTPVGADFDRQEAARLMSLVIQAEFDRAGVNDMDAVFTRDMALFGITAALPCVEHNRIVLDRIIPTELDFDEYEWRRGNGRTMYQSFPMDRQVMKELYPDNEEAIDAAPPADLEDSQSQSAFTAVSHDLILVRRAWHARSSPDAEDGKFAAVIDGATLEYEDYDDIEVGPIFMTASKPVIGLVGESLMEDMSTAQEELDVMSERVQASHWLVGVPRFLIRRGAKLAIQKINNRIGGILETDNPAADVVPFAADAVPPQTYQYFQSLPGWMAQISGVSQMASQSEKPADITAARALELLDDIESDRKVVAQRNRESFYVQIAKRFLKLMREIDGYKVIAKEGAKAIEIVMGDLKISEGEYLFTVMPTNFMAKTPARRLQQAQDLVNMKLLPPEKVARTIGIPDLETETSLMNAPYDAIEKRLSAIVRTGDYHPPHAMLNLAYGQKRAGEYYCRGEVDGLPEERLELLRRFATDCAAAANPPPPPPDPNAAPPGAGAPPPGPGPGAPMSANQMLPPGGGPMGAGQMIVPQ